MNYIEAVVQEIHCVDNINIVRFQAQEQSLSMMSLELDSSLAIGDKVILGAKATTVAISKALNEAISISNQLPSTIYKVDNGELLSSIKLRFFDATIESIITKNSSVKMNLKEGDEVIVLIKASDLSIVEVC